MTHTMYDAAYPQPHGIPGTDTVLLYCGGDTVHVWTDTEIAAQPEPYRVPCWVRSNPTTATQGANDGNAMVAWLRLHGAPTSTATVLDLETAINPTYVWAYAAVLHNVGYLVLPYGSSSSLFSNPQLDGYFVAKPGATGIVPGTVATQYGYYGSYDLSWIVDSIPIWDTTPMPQENELIAQNLEPIFPGEITCIGLVPVGAGPYANFTVQTVTFSYDAVGTTNNPSTVPVRVIYFKTGAAPEGFVVPAEANANNEVVVTKGRSAQLNVPTGINALSIENLGAVPVRPFWEAS